MSQWFRDPQIHGSVAPAAPALKPTRLLLQVQRPHIHGRLWSRTRRLPCRLPWSRRAYRRRRRARASARLGSRPTAACRWAGACRGLDGRRVASWSRKPASRAHRPIPPLRSSGSRQRPAGRDYCAEGAAEEGQGGQEGDHRAVAERQSSPPAVEEAGQGIERCRPPGRHLAAQPRKGFGPPSICRGGG